MDGPSTNDEASILTAHTPPSPTRVQSSLAHSAAASACEYREPAPLSSRQLYRVPELGSCAHGREQTVVFAVVPVLA
jgi:hypothetical protein